MWHEPPQVFEIENNESNPSNLETWKLCRNVNIYIYIYAINSYFFPVFNTLLFPRGQCLWWKISTVDVIQNITLAGFIFRINPPREFFPISEPFSPPLPPPINSRYNGVLRNEMEKNLVFSRRYINFQNKRKKKIKRIEEKLFVLLDWLYLSKLLYKFSIIPTHLWKSDNFVLPLYD